MIKILGEDEPPIVSRGLMPISRPSDSKKRSTAVAKTIFDLKNYMRIIEEMVIGLEVVVEQMETLDKEKVAIG
jgi:hypothetical protein